MRFYWSALFVLIAWLTSSSEAATTTTTLPPLNLVANGGFETGALQPTAIGVPVPDCVGLWCDHQGGPIGAVDEGTANLVSAPVNSGLFAVHIDTISAMYGHYVVQDLLGTTACFTWSFHVLRASGVNTLELVAGWDRGAGAGVNITGLRFDDMGITFIAWDAVASFNFVLTPNVWHTIEVHADGTTGTQSLSIDGMFVGDAVGSLPVVAPTSLIVGDVSGTPDRGDYTYDDFSLTVDACENDEDAFDDGELIRESSDVGAYVVYGGAKFRIADAAAMSAMGFDPGDVEVLPDGALDGVPTIPQDDTVLKELSSSAVYVTVSGVKHLAPDGPTYVALGYELDDVHEVPDGTLAAIPTGSALIPPAGHASAPRYKKYCRSYRNPLSYVDCPGCLRLANRCRRIKGVLKTRPKQSGSGDHDVIFNIDPDHRYEHVFRHYGKKSDWNYEGTPFNPCHPRTDIDNCQLHCEIIWADRRSCRCPGEEGCTRYGCACSSDHRERCAVRHGDFRRLTIGRRIEVIGPLVTDEHDDTHRNGHRHGWPEIHPVWKVAILRDVKGTRAFAPATPPTASCDTKCCDGSQEQGWPATSEDACLEHAFDSCAANPCPDVRRVRYDKKTAFSDSCACTTTTTTLPTQSFCRTVIPPGEECGIVDPYTNPFPSITTGVSCQGDADCTGGWACFSFLSTCNQLFTTEWPSCVARDYSGCGNYILFGGGTFCCCPVTELQQCVAQPG